MGSSPVRLDSANPSLGIKNVNISVINGNLVCSFRRDNSNSHANYYNLNTQSPYFITAYGPLQGTGRRNVFLNFICKLCKKNLNI